MKQVASQHMYYNNSFLYFFCLIFIIVFLIIISVSLNTKNEGMPKKLYFLFWLNISIAVEEKYTTSTLNKWGN